MVALKSPDVGLMERRAATRAAARVEVPSWMKRMTKTEQAMFQAAKNAVAGKDGQRALEAIAGFKFAGRWKRTAEDMVRTGDMDATTGRRVARTGSGEQENLDGATGKVGINAAGEAYEKYLAGGIKSATLNAGEKKIVTDQMRAYIDANAELKAHYMDPKTGAVPDEVIEGLLSDRKFMNDLGERLNDLFDPNKLPTEVDTKILDANTRLQNAKDAVGDLSRREGEQKTRATAAEAKKNEFTTDTTVYTSSTFGTGKSKEGVYQTLASDTNVQEFLGAQAQYKQLVESGAIDRYDKSTGKPVRTPLSDARTRVDTLRVKYGAKIQEFEALGTERAGVYREYDAATTEYTKTKVDLTTQQGEQAKAQTELNTLVAQRQDISEQFAEKVRNAVYTTAAEYLPKRIEEIMQESPKYTPEFDDELKAEVDGKIADHIEARYKTRRPKVKMKKSRQLQGLLLKEVEEPVKDRKGDFVYETDKKRNIIFEVPLDEAKIKPDIDLLESYDPAKPDTTGPRAVVRKVLEDAYAVNGKVSPEDKAKIDTLLHDRSFVDAYSVSITKTLLAANTGVGNTPSATMQNMFSQTQWGQEAFAAMAEASPDAKAFVEAETGEPVSKDSAAKLAEKDKKDPKGKKLATGILAVLGIGLFAISQLLSKE